MWPIIAGIPGKLKNLKDTIDTYYTNLTSTINTRAPASTALSTATWTNTHASSLLNASNRSQYFTANGTWTRPDGVEWISVIMWGGGGGGASGQYSSAMGGYGSPGGDTYISAHATRAKGGFGGGLVSASRSYDENPQNTTISQLYQDIVPYYFNNSIGGNVISSTSYDGSYSLGTIYAGRAPGTRGSNVAAGPGGNAGGGGGGAGYMGNGGNGGNAAYKNNGLAGASAAANSGAGGGGGGSTSNSDYGARGGAGGNGGMIVILPYVRVTGNVTVTVGAGGAGAAGVVYTYTSGAGGNGGSGGCIIFW